MSLLSTFTILFETDAKEANKELALLSDEFDNVEDSAGDATFAIDGATHAFNDNSKSSLLLSKNLLGLAGSLLSVNFLIQQFFDNALNAEKINKFSQSIRSNAVEVDAWGATVERSGGSAESFRNSIESLDSSLTNVKFGGGTAVIETLSMMGISATDAHGELKGVFDLLPELAERFESMSPSESRVLGQRLGLDQGTILTLQQGRQAVDELVERQKQLGGITQEGAETAEKFNDQWDDTKRVFNSVFMATTSQLLPALTKILELLEGGAMWVKDNQDLIEGFFIAIATVITAVYLPAMAKATAATLISPFGRMAVAIAAVGTAFALLWEDGKSWINDGESLMGELLGPFDNFKDSVLGIIQEIELAWGRFVDNISGKIGKVTGFFSDIGGSIGSGIYDIVNTTNKATDTFQNYNSIPLNNGAGTYYNTNTNRNINVEVGGATINASGMDAQQAQNAFGESLNRSLEMAIGQIDDGVDR